MLEVEVKYPVADFTALEQRLADAGARLETTCAEVDHYFNAPDRDFAQTDEALRLRRIRVTPRGESSSSRHTPCAVAATAHGVCLPQTAWANFVTYKGPKRDAQTKTRTEIELPLGDGDAPAADFVRLLLHLGYRSVAEVHKQRRSYRLQRAGFAVEVCLDEVTDVGRFVELEIQAPEDRLESARQTLLTCAADLGFQQSERRSYLEMLLTKQETRNKKQETESK